MSLLLFIVNQRSSFPRLRRVSTVSDERDLGDDRAGPGQDEAILVFLPGWDDISKLFDTLRTHEVFGKKDKFLVLPLHGSMPTVNQRAIFERPPKGVRKIVLATNIAETSITIDDVGFVIDCGKHKEKSYRAEQKVQCLLPTWVSKASATQRRGRAGRVRPGVCFHLFTQRRESLFMEYQVSSSPCASSATKHRDTHLPCCLSFLPLAQSGPRNASGAIGSAVPAGEGLGLS